MLAEKKMLDLEMLDRQMAVELPDRAVAQIVVTIANILNNNTVTVTVQNINVALQVCAAVLSTRYLTCTISQ